MIAFFIDYNQKYYKIVLKFEHFVSKYLNQRIANLVKKTLNFYKVLNRVLAITTNNVSNNKIFITSFLQYINFNTITHKSILNDIFNKKN